ncbi:MAG: hypothetical protein NTX49_10365 [Chlamydiae bacterium]|nr:hypothetical protein [Chlamydiota bacterium]
MASGDFHASFQHGHINLYRQYEQKPFIEIDAESSPSLKHPDKIALKALDGSTFTAYVDLKEFKTRIFAVPTGKSSATQKPLKVFLKTLTSQSSQSENLVGKHLPREEQES